MLEAIINDIKSCDDVVLATFGAAHPDLRHLTNAMNRDITKLNLFFMTGRGTPKYTQLKNNPYCTLYYFNPQTRHAVRLFGKMKFIDDVTVRRQYWRDEYKKFGYTGPESDDFILMRFVPDSYKIYIGHEVKTGKI